MAEGASRVHTIPQTAAAPEIASNQRQRASDHASHNASKTTTGDFQANTHPSSDPAGKFKEFAMHLGRNGGCVIGHIIDSAAAVNAYIVEVWHYEKASIIAEALSHTSTSVLGATEFNAYVAGTPVLVYVHPALSQGIIVGAFASPANTGLEAQHDVITQTSRFNADDGHMRFLKLQNAGEMMNFSAWRPYDATSGSEWGAMASTGLGVSLDDFMVRMSVNEFTGVFGFYHDSLLRVSGYNMQTWTAGHERDAYMDEAEYNDTQGYTPYPWEHVGALKPGQNGVQQYSAGDLIRGEGYPYYGIWENKYENQQPFHRTQNFYGYYGQGGRSVVCAPPENGTWWTYQFQSAGKPPAPFAAADTQNPLSVPQPPVTGTPKEQINEELPAIGLAEDNTGLDGRRFIASAKGISLVKRLLLPVPSRLRRPEDGQGDTKDNYKFAGQEGGGPAHTITGDLEAADKLPHLQRAAGVLDLHGYLFNYSGLHPFFWHSKDYKTWEQSELEHAQYNHVVPDYSQLKGSMYLNEPPHLPIQVDHRYGQQKFYVSESFFTLLEDGGIVIGDGYGAEIRMTAGTVTISAPGDVWFKTGKNAQIWAGRDIIMRANNTVDVSSTEQNVRIKAEQNVMIMGGNESSNKLGGVLIESKAKEAFYDFTEPGDAVIFGGVILRAKKAEVITHAKDIYLRTVGGYEGTDDRAGVITLDASRGEGTIMTKSKYAIHYIDDPKGSISHVFRTEPDANAKVVNLFNQYVTYLNGPLLTDGYIIADGQKQGFSFMARNSIYINKGHIFTPKGGMVDPCQGECISDIDEAVEEVRIQINEELPAEFENIDNNTFDPLWYNDGRAGHKTTILEAGFSFRRDQDYLVDGFELFEDRWQQLARLSGQELDDWTERPVKTHYGTETWPFPGKAKLNDEEVFVTQDFTIAENVGGNAIRDKDRGGPGALNAAYSTPKFGEPKRKTISGNYKIIKP